MNKQEVMEMDKKYVMQSYSRIPIVIDRGKGVRVWDKDGKEYLDFVSGIGVNAIGHCHPEVLAAISSQMQRLFHCSNLYYIELQTQLAKALCDVSFADKVFFCNSGAEANEAAIKLVHKFGSKQKGRPYEIITMEDSFHGRTLATLKATGQTKYQDDFGPFPPGFKYAPFNDLEGVRNSVSHKTCAIMLEPIQGEGGLSVASESFITGLRQLCDERGILLVVDEVQCGLGRTGKMFAYEHYGIEPDIMTLAKCLGGGMPIGATLAKEEIASLFGPGSHASTFGGNPLVCSAALAFLKVLEKEKLVERAKEKGKYFREKLMGLKKKFPFLKEIRGKGLMVGLKLTFPGKDVVAKCRQKGLLINCTAENVLRFLPPLIVDNKDIDEAIEILKSVMRRA